MDPRTGLPVVGMVGAGQLARMTHQAAVALGQSLRVLATGPDEPAALVASDVVCGRPDDLAALRRFAVGCDVLTFDHEHVPTEHLRALVAEGVRVYPGPDALRHAQDKLVMRRALAALGVPVPPFREVTRPRDAVLFGAEHGWPCVLKAARGGYDGRGLWMLASPTDARRMVAELLAAGTPLLVEQCVAMRGELAAMVARSPFGQGAAWPVVRTVQRDGICVEVLAPAPDLAEESAVAAQQLAIDLATALGVVGLLAVEL
ncbi:MAG: 5-(carboxyamino)imidazole ribonucleotide synthase, partial [Pseudonocardiales bacterium]|nr:5-(carboxyamino)imidazole ribonucleotide synthase [Pseudonocardiales bacterium]